MEWIDVSSKLPPSHTEVLAFDALGHIVVDWMKGNEWVGDSPYIITHWMPLPAPPTSNYREG